MSWCARRALLADETLLLWAITCQTAPPHSLGGGRGQRAAERTTMGKLPRCQCRVWLRRWWSTPSTIWGSLCCFAPFTCRSRVPRPSSAVEHASQSGSAAVLLARSITPPPPPRCLHERWPWLGGCSLLLGFQHLVPSLRLDSIRVVDSVFVCRYSTSWETHLSSRALPRPASLEASHVRGKGHQTCIHSFDTEFATRLVV